MGVSKQEQARIDEALAVTPEEKQRRRDEYDARARAFAQAGGDTGAPFVTRRRLDESEPMDFGALMARVQARAEAEKANRMALPCYSAMYPNGIEPEDPSQRVADAVGAAACDAVGAWTSCERAITGFGCPRTRAVHVYDTVRDNLLKARVPKLDYELVLRHAAGKAALYPYDSMLLVQAIRQTIRTGERQEIRFREANEQLPRGDERKNAAHLRGSETLALLGGAKGRGKTTAAVYALAYGHGKEGPESGGGLYTTEYEFTRPRNAGGIDINEVKRAKTLLIDQFGRGHLGDSKYALSSIEEVVDARKAEKLPTYLVGNFTWNDEFMARYDELVVSRILGHGVVVIFRGADLREQLRSPERGRAA